MGLDCSSAACCNAKEVGEWNLGNPSITPTITPNNRSAKRKIDLYPILVRNVIT